MHPSRNPIALALLGLIAVGCSSAPRLTDAPARVDTLVSSIERVHATAEEARAVIADSLERLSVLGNAQFGADGALAAYADFVQTIDSAKEHAQRFGAALEAMQAAAQPVFERWCADLGLIQSERLRKRAEGRLAMTRVRYDAITDAATPAREQLEAYVQTLRDHATFLAHDLNASALGELREELRLVTAATRELENRFDLCQQAARTYADSAALPAAASPGR